MVQQICIACGRLVCCFNFLIPEGWQQIVKYWICCWSLNFFYGLSRFIDFSNRPRHQKSVQSSYSGSGLIIPLNLIPWFYEFREFSWNCWFVVLFPCTTEFLFIQFTKLNPIRVVLHFQLPVKVWVISYINPKS